MPLVPPMKKLVVNSESRLINFDLYNRFKIFRPELFGSTNFTPVSTEYQNITYASLNYYSPLILDPVEMISNSPNNLSWKMLKGLENILENSSLIGITDTYYFWNYQLETFAKRNRIPFYTIIWCNLPNHISSWLPPYSIITNKVIKNSELFILRNYKAYEFTDSIGIPRSKTRVIYPGISLEQFTPAKIKQVSEKIRILYVGALSEAKGIRLLLQAFAAISKENNVELHIAGKGALTNEIINASNYLPIVYHGQVNYSQLPTLYQTADIFCSPSQTSSILGIPFWHEYFSYTLLEAQASGLPIIATKSGGIVEEVEPQNSFIEEQNLDQLIAALNDMINDTEKRNEIGLKNRLFAEKKYDLAIQSELLENELVKLV